MAKRVFISSTSLDLKKYRTAAIKVCQTLGFEAIAMEDFEAMGVGATEGSKRKLREADLFVGIIAHRYGYIEDGYDRSVTECEFDYAGERGLDRLCFMVDPVCEWPKRWIERRHATELNTFKAKIEKQVIRSLFTDVDNFAQSLTKALVNWQAWRAARGGELEAVYAMTPDDIPHQPEALFGRDQLLNDVNGMLDKGKRVLLQGFGGMGKTALAAALAAWRLNDNRGPVLWLRAGTEDRDQLFTALARPFNADQTVSKEASPANQARLIRALLVENRVHLVVLDDVWNGRALTNLLNVNALPAGMPILVTSRLRFPGLTRLDVSKLSRQAALALLSHYAESDWANDADAAALCETLGDHAFAVRVAALTMALDGLLPGELLRRIGDRPWKIAAPEGMAEEGRASLEDMLKTSLFTLDEQARAVFFAFGALFSPSATPELLSRYMGIDTAEIEDALNRLQRRGLAERTTETGDHAAEYRIPDLAYSYARAQADAAAHSRALEACLAYMDTHKGNKPEHFAALRSELDNFSGAVTWAMSVGGYVEVERFANGLYRSIENDGNEGFLHLQGYTAHAINLLQQAALAAERLGEPRHQAWYLGYLGSAYRDIGQARQGMKQYRQALKLYRSLGDVSGEGFTLGRIGIAYRMLGQAETAIDYLEQALEIARRFKDVRAEGINLANLGIAHRQKGALPKTIDYLEQALQISRQRGDERGEAINLGNLGDAYRDLGELDRAARYYEQAHSLCAQAGDKRGEGINLGRLGDLYRAQGDYDTATDYLSQALVIARATGDKRGEAINLGRLGDAQRDLGLVNQALAQHTQALGIARAMDDKRGEAYSTGDLGDDYAALGRTDEAREHWETARALFSELNMSNRAAELEDKLADVSNS